MDLRNLGRRAAKGVLRSVGIEPSTMRRALSTLTGRRHGGARAVGGPDSSFAAVADYWTHHNVTSHRRFGSPDESLAYFHWRCDQYPGYLDLMPVAGFDGEAILDYGCGPGHDLVGFLEYSHPRLLVGVDVSASSLGEAHERVALHGTAVKLERIPGTAALPFDAGTFDYVHSSGVLHHVPDLEACLRELRRVLKPEGRIRVMVYNRNSIWMHLYVAWVLRYRDRTLDAALSIDDAFARSTDGPECPIANCYTPEEFARIAARAGFKTRIIGVACSLFERLQLAQCCFQACMDERLEPAHREFLLELTYDASGVPLYKGVPAGVDLVLELTKEI